MNEPFPDEEFDPRELDDGEPLVRRCSCACGCSIRVEGGGKCGMCRECCFCGEYDRDWE